LTTGTRIYHRDHPRTWFCSAQSCREENSEAFAGQHAANSSSFYVFDKASAIPDRIFEVAEGGLTDGEPMMFLFGNPTRNTGKFYRTTYGSEQTRWKSRAIDSRTCSLPNQVQIAEWLEDYGEDSDFFRVRIRGLPPMASELQFIDQTRLNLARRRTVHEILPDEPLIAGFDVSGGGAAWNVIRSLALCVKRVELLIEALLRRLPSIDRAAEPRRCCVGSVSVPATHGLYPPGTAQIRIENVFRYSWIAASST
jgi:hypothetical protein